jgi:hypothetical protein
MTNLEQWLAQAAREGKGEHEVEVAARSQAGRRGPFADRH